MTDMISYLKEFREEEPVWLENFLRGEQITFKDVISSKVGYYPGNEYDGTLIKVGNMSHSVHSFLYVVIFCNKLLNLSNFFIGQRHFNFNVLV